MVVVSIVVFEIVEVAAAAVAIVSGLVVVTLDIFNIFTGGRID